MRNSEATAASWIQRLAARPELPFGSQLAEHFKKARVTSLCECGCCSFQCEVAPAGHLLPPLFTAQLGGLRSFEAAFNSSGEEPIDVVIYADERGLLQGVDISWGLSNHGPLPDGVELLGLLYTTPDL